MFRTKHPRFQLATRVAIIFWVLAIAAIFIWVRQPGTDLAWDVHVYRNAIHALSLGHDPYIDGINVQQAFHDSLAQHPDAVPPYTYVYSPLTLPLLRWIGSLPVSIAGTVYWLLTAAGMITTIYVGFRFATPSERPLFLALTPLALFFPGLIFHDVLLSGNVAFILYGLCFAAALLGWTKGRWLWFYLAVLAASVCKAPMLSLLAVPLFSVRKQWTPAIVTGAAGLALFAMQPHLWPTLFRNYLQAVELQFSFNHDFGISPAGILADALYDHLPYQKTSSAFYLFNALIFAAILFYLSRKFLAGYLTIEQWVPVMMPGVILLNPRILEYDVAPITLMMALVLWRLCAHSRRLLWQALLAIAFLLTINISSKFGWRTAECLTLVTLFFAGSFDLYRKARATELSASA